MVPLSLRLTVAYDGSRYLGWQQTREGPSIQGVLRQTAEMILQRPVQVEGASRTDAGVHALGQVVSLRCQESRYTEARFLRSLIRLLPPDIVIVESAYTPDSFHPTLDAKAKTYWYLVGLRPLPLERHRVWQLPNQGIEPAALDLTAIRRAAQLLIGTHDFSAFAVDHVDMPIKDPHCTLMSIEVEELQPELIRLAFFGNRFLYKMVRSLAGTLVDCGRARLCPEDLPDILASRRRERAGICAPAHGLTLAKVHYEDEADEAVTR
jgi:tRNA pseudouridine38-40 synthase